ncbi:hypothetical protein ABIE78_001983 [Sinorhizobium fredii]|uniref:Uncharacterized protein n=1 Tax=Sinorhizobium fredii (strain USDA 257) TaxID=1185652 RepID=I3X8F1_SINF2|nr:hypothetical protein [Sinorhizobium fredii]AFL52157.1 hypothetical protein USDA257_c36000 [Sinorhizobium fredii USDA 257]AFL52883.1 hypothetical protein USDA257_c43440 [Sinorhizobium fredii USDA 257]
MKAECEPLADAIARHRQSFSGEGIFALVTMPDGTGFYCVPDGEQMSATRLSRAEMLEKLIELYGLSAFRGN